MKCNSKKVQEYKYNKAKEQRKQERKKYLGTLTEEEREQFLQHEKKEQEKSFRMLNNLVKTCSMFGIKEYYK